MISVAFTPITGLVEKYLFNDWEFLIYLFIMIAFDSLLGFLKNWKRKTLSSKAWGQVIFKLISYMSLLIVAHIFVSFRIGGVKVELFDWFEKLVLTSLMVKEGISIIENVGSINETWVPKWLLNKLKEFDETGKFKNK
jgi:toxin secretion/phage lysis holin